MPKKDARKLDHKTLEEIRIRAVSLSQANVTISWTAGKLQSAPTVVGPWTDVPNATSPFTEGASQNAKFFRSVQ